jgi:hypothetical protein
MVKRELHSMSRVPRVLGDVTKFDIVAGAEQFVSKTV